ncbi:hypothetical protein BLA29_014425, partial [Euroglyphus maynei]
MKSKNIINDHHHSNNHNQHMKEQESSSLPSLDNSHKVINGNGKSPVKMNLNFNVDSFVPSGYDKLMPPKQN